MGGLPRPQAFAGRTTHYINSLHEVLHGGISARRKVGCEEEITRELLGDLVVPCKVRLANSGFSANLVRFSVRFLRCCYFQIYLHPLSQLH